MRRPAIRKTCIATIAALLITAPSAWTSPRAQPVEGDAGIGTCIAQPSVDCVAAWTVEAMSRELAAPAPNHAYRTLMLPVALALIDAGQVDRAIDIARGHAGSAVDVHGVIAWWLRRGGVMLDDLRSPTCRAIDALTALSTAMPDGLIDVDLVPAGMTATVVADLLGGHIAILDGRLTSFADDIGGDRWASIAPNLAAALLSHARDGRISFGEEWVDLFEPPLAQALAIGRLASLNRNGDREVIERLYPDMATLPIPDVLPSGFASDPWFGELSVVDMLGEASLARDLATAAAILGDWQGVKRHLATVDGDARADWMATTPAHSPPDGPASARPADVSRPGGWMLLGFETRRGVSYGSFEHAWAALEQGQPVDWASVFWLAGQDQARLDAIVREFRATEADPVSVLAGDAWALAFAGCAMGHADIVAAALASIDRPLPEMAGRGLADCAFEDGARSLAFAAIAQTEPGLNQVLALAEFLSRMAHEETCGDGR